MQAETRASRAGQESAGAVLLMDDDALLREALSDLLERRGYAVEACADAAEGLMRLRQGLTPQVIVLDLHMPGIDGWEFRLIQKRHRPWQLRAPFRASDVRELIEAQWRSFH